MPSPAWLHYINYKLITTYLRRKFLKTAVISAAGLTIVPNTIFGKARGYTSPSDKLNIAGIDLGGMGRRNLANMKTENIVVRDEYAEVDWDPKFDRRFVEFNALEMANEWIRHTCENGFTLPGMPR